MLKVKGGFRCVQGGAQAHRWCALVSAEAQLRAATICLPFTFTGLQQERLDGRTDGRTRASSPSIGIHQGQKG